MDGEFRRMGVLTAYPAFTTLIEGAGPKPLGDRLWALGFGQWSIAVGPVWRAYTGIACGVWPNARGLCLGNMGVPGDPNHRCEATGSVVQLASLGCPHPGSLAPILRQHCLVPGAEAATAKDFLLLFSSSFLGSRKHWHLRRQSQ
jgi:hypothetical protein